MSSNPYFLNEEQIKLIEEIAERLILEGRGKEAAEFLAKFGLKPKGRGREVEVAKPDPALKGEQTPTASQYKPQTPATPRPEPEVAAANQTAGSTPTPRRPTAVEKSRANREKARQEQQRAAEPTKPETPTPAPAAKPEGLTTGQKAAIAGAVAAPVAIGAFVAAKKDDETPKAAAKPSATGPLMDPTPMAQQKDLIGGQKKPTEKDIFGEPAGVDKPAAKPAAPKATTPKPAKPAETAPEDKHAKSREMYQQHQDMERAGDSGSNAAYWRAEAQRAKEEGRTAPNDFSDTAVGKFFSGLTGGKKKVDEATRYLSINPNSVNMFAEAKKLKGNQDKLDKNKNNKLDAEDFKILRGEKVEEEKKADKDYDGDGKVESSKDEVWGSRLKAAKAAGKMEEAAEPVLKKSTTSDPDFAVPSANPDAPESPIKFVPRKEDEKPSTPPLPPKRPSGLKETYLNILKGK